MDQSLKVQISAAAAAVFHVVGLVFNGAYAFDASASIDALGFRILVFITFGLNLTALTSLVLQCTIYLKKLQKQSRGLKVSAWPILAGGMTIAVVALTLTGASLIWLVLRKDNIPSRILQANPITTVVVWFVVWVFTFILQSIVFHLLGTWTRQVLKALSTGRPDLGLGIRLPPVDETRPHSVTTNMTYQSQDITLNSAPQSPMMRRGSDTPMSSLTRLGASSSRSKLIRSASRSTLDLPAFPAGEAMCIDHNFDVEGNPNAQRGLDPIPGSHPGSPQSALDPPRTPTTPHAASSDTPIPLGWTPISPSQLIPGSPPSSPPNFSRPTSSQFSKPFEGYIVNVDMPELTHPSFKHNQSSPPSTAMGNPTILLPPVVEGPSSPRTLDQLRNSVLARHTALLQRWPSMPKIDMSDRPSTAGSAAPSTLLGSPGPSIIDDDEPSLPPILPGFILSAGQRSSFVGYGKRKSVKQERPKSQVSTRSRLSQNRP